VGIQDIVCAFISVLMVMMTITLQYEIKRRIWNILPRLKRHPRVMINVLVLALLAGHTISVWLYGLMFWLLDSRLGIHGLAGQHEQNFISYVYFSASTYSSLGFGDIFPTGPLRMLVGVEVLNGLLMIGLSVTLTYLAMERFWGTLHSVRQMQAEEKKEN